MSNRELAEDQRPANCRFRLQDEGKIHFRSVCYGCGATISTGLGSECRYKELKLNKLLAEELRGLAEQAFSMGAKAQASQSYALMSDLVNDEGDPIAGPMDDEDAELIDKLLNNLPTIIEALEK